MKEFEIACNYLGLTQRRAQGKSICLRLRIAEMEELMESDQGQALIDAPLMRGLE